MEVVTIRKPFVNHYVQVKSDPDAGKWYSHRQTHVYKVKNAQNGNFQIIDESEDAIKEIPCEDCRLFTSLLEYLRIERVIDLYRDDQTGKITLEEACDNCFGVTLSRNELVQLAHEMLIFAWSE